MLLLYALKTYNLNKKLHFISGKIKVVRKDTLCWYFNKHRKLSSDRRVLVREADFIPPSRNENDGIMLDMINEKKTISISDYCIFKIPNKDFLVIGLVKSFANMKQPNWKKLAYFKKSVELSEENKKKVGFPASFFALRSEDKTLQLYNVGIGYISISNYCKTIPPPIVFNGKRNRIPDNIYHAIKDEVKIIE